MPRMRFIPRSIPRTIATFALLAASVLAPQLNNSASATPAAASYSHAGRWLTDDAGRVMITTGVNMVYKRAPYTQEAIGFGDDDAAFLADNGFDSVRVGLIWKAIEPAPGVYDDGYLASVRRTVEMLASHGIASLIDMHQDMYNERFQGEFAPDWAVLDDGLPAQPQLGFPGNMFGQPALARAYDHFLANAAGPGGIGLQDRFATAWTHAAAYFADAPGVLGYDLLNEPWPGSTYPQCFTPAGCRDDLITAMHRRVASAIRTVDARTLLFYEPYSLFGVGIATRHGALGVADTGFSFHDYCPTAAITNTNVGCEAFDEQTFVNAENQARSTDSTLLLSEFGATSNTEILAGIVDRAARHRIGWQYWAYCGCNDPTTANLAEQALVTDPARPPVGANINGDKLRTLGVPHPKAVAGIPVSYAVDRRSGVFTMHYSTARADGAGQFAPRSRTTVATPRVQFPNGYRALATGATVTSPPNAAVLELSSNGDTSDVSVTITPA